MNILVLVSGGGTNLQALIDAERAGRFATDAVKNITENDAENSRELPNSRETSNSRETKGRIAAVVSDRAGVYALERARAAGIPALTEEPDRRLPKPEQREDLSGRLLLIAKNYQADLIILAGFLSILQGEIISEYEGRIINLHPSLLPKYGGPGMYGLKVHKAVLAAGEKESGCTIHLVDEGTDTGPILLQRKVPVLQDDTAESLAERIHREEHSAIVEAAELFIRKMNK